MAESSKATKATSNGLAFTTTSDLGAARRVVEGNVNSWKYKDSDGKVKTLTKAQLQEAGLQTHAEAVTTTLSYGDSRFAVNDAKDLPSLHAAIDRIYSEYSAMRKAISANDGKPLSVPKPKEGSALVADPVVGKPADGVDPICAFVVDMFRSGQALIWAQALGKPMRDAAESKFGKATASGSVKATDDNV